MGVPRRKWRGATEETRGGEERGELRFRATLSPPRQRKRGSSRWWGPGGAGRCGGGGAAGPRLQSSLGRSRQAHPDALLLQPSSPGHGSRARGHPVCGVTGGSGETREDGGGWARGLGRARHVLRGPGAAPSSPTSSSSSPSLGAPRGPACCRLPDRPFCPTRNGPIPRLLRERSRPEPAAQLVGLPHCPQSDCPSHFHVPAPTSCKVLAVAPPCAHTPPGLRSLH